MIKRSNVLNCVKTILIVLVFSGRIFAQDQKYMDSLKLESQSKIDSARFKAYSFLAWNLKETNKKEALHYAGLLLKEATTADNKKWIARSLSDHSVIYQYGGDAKKALDFAERALTAAKVAGVKKDIAGALLNLGAMKSKNNKLAEALEYQLQALKIYEELKKNYYIAVCCNAIGMSYNNIGNYKKSNEYLIKALTLSRSKGNLYLESITLGALADNFKSLKQGDSSLFYYQSAKSIFKQMQNYSNYATACNNIGEFYFEKGDFKRSELEYKEAIEVSKLMEDTGSVALSEANLAKVFIRSGNYKEAEVLLLNALATAEKLGNEETRLIVCQNLMRLYTNKNDPGKAEFYFKKYDSMKDSMFSEETAIRFSEAQTKFDVEKKDLEILKNKAELEIRDEERVKKNLIISLIITLLIGTAISSIFFYRKKQVQQRATLDAEIASQREIRAKAIIEAEEKERRRIAQDLHDGIGQILSAAKLNLSSLESQINLTNQSQKDALKNTLNLIDDSVKEVRAVSHNMMPNTLIKLGLASAVREFITKIGSLPHLKIDLEIVGLDQRLEENTETSLYRAIQEVVSNIIKHANANKISIQLIRHEKDLSVVIEDNGTGFDTSKVNEFEGIGLKNIISRVEFIRGKVHFDSTPGKGTTVLIDVPLV